MVFAYSLMDFLSSAGVPQREKDVCDYEIFLEKPTASRAASIQIEAQRIAEPWTKDYIWQDQSFSLKINDGGIPSNALYAAILTQQITVYLALLPSEIVSRTNGLSCGS